VFTVLVLGANGMLGSQVVETLKHNKINVYFTKTNTDEPINFQYRYGIDDLEQIISKIPDLDYVFNCIGAIPQRVTKPENFKINWELPLLLQNLAEKIGFKVIQIASDCAFDGLTGKYSEEDLTSAKDAYGESKVLGEIISPKFMHIRCSVIGNDEQSRSLRSWLISHDKNSVVAGYINHFWNGVTTLSFAKVAAGIVLNDSFVPGIHHLVPSSIVTKYELLKLIARSENRQDLSILPHKTKTKVDRTLTTLAPDLNQALWKLGGYDLIPSVEDLVIEFAFRNTEKERR
jgi:dTDP-4-dehydrorhamnose reductase